MATPDFPIGQGNLLPAIMLRCLEPDPNRPGRVRPKDLTGCTVRFQMSPIEGRCSGGKALDVVAFIIDAKGGVVGYQWVAGDTDVPGLYKAAMQVTDAQGRSMDFPNDGYVLVRIRPKATN